MDKYVKRTQRDYSMSFKLNIVKEIESGSLSTCGACKRYGIQSRSTVMNWLRKFGNFDWENQTPSNMPKSPEQRIMELEAEVKLLKKQKALLERQAYVSDKKSIIFDMMIDLAEQEYQIDIRKNSPPPRTVETFREKEQETVSFACQLFGVDRQVYYRNLKRRDTRKNNAKQVVAMVAEIRKHSPKMGGRKLYFLLKEELKMLKIGRDKFFNVLRNNHLLIIPKRSYHKTTNSLHRFRKHTNLIKDYQVKAPNRLWVADITYLGNRENPAYLSLITDAYSKKIVGYDVSDSLASTSSLKALKSALKKEKI